MVGENIKRIRLKRGFTQAQIADKLNISEKTMSSWEVNRTEPNMGNIEMLAKVLSCQKSELLGDSPISNEDYVVLKKISALDEYGKRAVELILNAEYDRCLSSKGNI